MTPLLLFLIPILGSVVIALGRITSIRPPATPGAHRGTISLSFAERLRYHRTFIYPTAAMILLGAATGILKPGIELVLMGVVVGIVSLPVRYHFTSSGVALGRVLFRPYSEFSGVRNDKTGLRLVAKDGNRDFVVRVRGAALTEASRLVGRNLASRASPATSRPSRLPVRRFAKLSVIVVPLLAGAIALGAASAFADGPTVDPSGTKVGDPTDLGCIGPGGELGYACVDADGNPDPLFAQAQKDEPFAYQLSAYVNQNRLAINFVWVLVTGYLVMFMQAGFAMVETGFCRAKSAMHVMMTNFMIYGIGMTAYWAIGFAIAFGGVGLTGPVNLGAGLLALNKEATISISGVHYGLFGYKGFFLAPDSLDVGIAVLFLFQMVFMDTAATILTGAVAERWTWISFMVWGVFVGALIQPIVANWAWGGGWLFQLANSGLNRPYVDFAGSGVVHMVGGFAGLAGARVLGPRLGKYNKDGSANAMPGHNLNMAAIGTFILAFGWFGFNPGSTLGASGGGNLRIGMVAVATMIAGSGGAIAAMAYAKASVGKWDPGYMINGLLGGLVAITAPSGYVSPISAFIIGLLAGGLVCFSMVFVEKTLKIDDPVGAFSVHGVCGAFGVLCVGLFADGTAPDFLVVGHPIKGLFFGDGTQLVAQVIGVAAIATWSFGTTWVLFKGMAALGILRSKPEDELRGLDLPEMGTHAYPVEDMPSERGIEPGTFVPGYTALPAGSSAGGA
ncbi:MAG: ammonium transporter [Dehalococcoidia bacterium]